MPPLFNWLAYIQLLAVAFLADLPYLLWVCWQRYQEARRG